MPRRFLALLILAALGQANCVCEVIDTLIAPPDLPVKAYAQDTWSDEKLEGIPENLLSERQAVLDCIRQWNDATAPYRKEGAPAPFEFQAFIPIPDFDAKTSLNDHKTVIYKIPELSAELREMVKSQYIGAGLNILGYGLPDGDALLFLGEQNNYLGVTPLDGQFTARATILPNVICHELGHVLGVQHHKEHGIMNPAVPWASWDGSGQYVTDVDVKAFRLVHPDDYR